MNQEEGNSITERRSRSIRKWGRFSDEANEEKRDARRIGTIIYSD